MTADVNLTEKVARAMWASWNPHGPRWHQTDDRSREETRSEARKALGVLADPDVLAWIAEVLDEHDMGRLTSGRPYCWTHHTHDPLHLAAAVVERLRGERP